MQVLPVKIERLSVPTGKSIYDVLAQVISELPEHSVVAISSKIIAICENEVLPLEGVDREELVKREADWYLHSENSKYRHHFTIKRNTIVGSAGIDMSNGDEHYILWPKDPQKNANDIREWLQKTYSVREIGVIVTDSTSTPLRRGAIGVGIAHSGFKAVTSYVGQEDLFGREMQLETANTAGGLAAAAVLAMGEGSEQTPIALISDIPTIEFSNANPSKEELVNTYLPLEDDLFAPFLANAPWQSM